MFSINFAIKVSDLEKRIASIEKWREEHDPIFKDNVCRFGICPDCSNEMVFVAGIATCRGCGFKHNSTFKDDPQREVRETPIDRKKYDWKKYGVRLVPGTTTYGVGDLAPSRERKDMVFCPACGHKL